MVLDSSRNLTQQVANELGKAIVKGDYTIDSNFPTEAELSSQFATSRSVTREAVKMLTAKGLISSRPRKGICVQPASSWNMFDSDVLNWTLNAKPSLELLKEFNQLRLAIEPEAVALACKNASETQIAAIGDAMRRISLAEQGNEDPLDADIDFHTSILKASNNRFFIQFCDFIQTALRVSIACTNRLKTVKQPAFTAEHLPVYECIRERDVEQGKQAMRATLENAMEIINNSIAEGRKLPEPADDHLVI